MPDSAQTRPLSVTESLIQLTSVTSALRCLAKNARREVVIGRVLSQGLTATRICLMAEVIRVSETAIRVEVLQAIRAGRGPSSCQLVAGSGCCRRGCARFPDCLSVALHLIAVCICCRITCQCNLHVTELRVLLQASGSNDRNCRSRPGWPFCCHISATSRC